MQRVTYLLGPIDFFCEEKKRPHPFCVFEVSSGMKTHIRNYRGGVTLGLLAVSLFNLSPRLLAQKCPEDGSLNRWEKRFDVNQDGKLDAQEMAAREAARKEAFQRLQGQYDKDGDGKLSESEKADRRTALEAKRKETIAKFDKDGDGRLNPQEREAAKAAQKTEKEAEQTKKVDKIRLDETQRAQVSEFGLVKAECA